MTFETSLLVALIVILFLLLVTTSFLALLYRARRRHRSVFGRWPIRTVALEELDPVFKSSQYGPGVQTEVRFVGQGEGVPGGTTNLELWILTVLATKARAMFEFGTCTGKTTYLWARNASHPAEIVTITLAPGQLETYCVHEHDSPRDTRRALKESVYEKFYYSGTEVESRIRQLFGDSKAFDETSYLNRFDLIFVDGSHARSYVQNDSEKALRMCAPGGLVLWHDYTSSRARGVYQTLNKLMSRFPLVHVQGTSFVAYRKPTSSGTA